MLLRNLIEISRLARGSISVCTIFLFILLVFSTQLFAETTSRPTIALVLSGGGAKGGAHVGVLEVIDELGVPIDIVVGTSMGAVIGGLYAVGYSAAEIKHITSTLDWEKNLRNELNRKSRYYRRKRDDDLFLIQNVLGYKNGDLLFPTGVVQGQQLYQSYKRYTFLPEMNADFAKLPISYAAVATDLASGERVVLQEGDLALAMLASMSVPGLFSPVEIDGKLLVDGGVVNNVPIEVAQSLGADILIVVDVGSPLLEKSEIKDFKAALNQLTNIYVNKNARASLAKLNNQDILIAPDLNNIGTADYDKMIVAVLPGKMAALTVESKLRPLAAFGKKSRNNSPVLEDFFLSRMLVDNNTALCTQTFHDYIPIMPKEYTVDEIDEYINRLYGLEMFESIFYGKEGESLVVIPKEKSWGPTFIQGSLLLATDFESDSAFTLALGITRTLINPLAGEWRIFGQIGEENGVFAEIYQPFTTDLKWFVNPYIGYNRKPTKVYENNDALAEYLGSKFDVGLALGRNFGEWGRASIGAYHEQGDYRLETGIEVIEESNYKDDIAFAEFEWDTMDNTYFPRTGSRAIATYTAHERDFEQVLSRLLIANSYGKHTFLLNGRYESTVHGIAPFDSLFKLGGLFRLSGLHNEQLKNQQMALIEGIYYYKLGLARSIPNYPFPIYIGASIEAGNTWEEQVSLIRHSYRPAGSLFLGMDTILGPIYLGYGLAESDRRSAYLFIGKAFA